MSINIEHNISLKSFNTFGIDHLAKAFVRITEASQLQELINSRAITSGQYMVLGGGSNILLSKDVDDLVLKNEIKGIEVVAKDDDYIWIRSGAGEKWHDLVSYAIEAGYGGIENLSLIPGTVGAAPMQNIGAYGIEIKDVFHSLEAIDVDSGRIRTFDSSDCQFGYRESVFKQSLKGKYIILSVTFKLTVRNHHLALDYGAIKDTLLEMGLSPSISSISKAVIHIRQSKLPDPAVIGNAGSFFKNPTIDAALFKQLMIENPQMPNYAAGEGYKIPAGWLIEQCGWKGYRQGDAGVHDKQALVLVNFGKASGREIFKLSLAIQANVFEKFGILLTPEVNLV